ncbi:hypothetical protein COCC4DRAFT_51163 [Bipolaris maydis ATCC 48331]|uniref:Uncharacterized protein n=2 Tax=Cochliobolus heterostrophus TaxID=5016 RepID=M2UF18_COCH5|nr:uncharacterized protein COCC4DRAFT_51163 [Bipolaris maydis ATCC 48331]EMD97114.1 hypothetical protein COCHEDRAFT_1220596 [Bipolaris maydis C5]KAH7551510.1 hypothetical protein BM1_09826 [Bipolaris maydis]ENI04422.1 hypothetical protein COCC4DRAFT_51163 [Bipolaris maydis ATCC 48331]KAJ5029572.1 hypothetical protein J3E73DRAFT_379440 [Bipolaris maydis]KAJ5061683.1 hypothetical protein J3E74DRAFT_417107 [Bipolaris maydis]
MNFRKSAQEECSIIAVASTILAQIAITALSLENLDRTPWVARGFFTFSLVSSIIAVYYATRQYCHLGRFIYANDVRAWIRGHSILDGDLYPRKALAVAHFNSDSAFRVVGADVPSVASVLTIAAPTMLLNASLNAFLLGLGIYLGFVWTWDLNETAGASSSRAVFIIYMVDLVVCYWVYAISNVIVADQSYVSEAELLGEKDALQSFFGLRNKDEESAGGSRRPSAAQHVSSQEVPSGTTGRASTSTTPPGEPYQEQTNESNATKSLSVEGELVRVLQEAARLRTESAKFDERMAQLLEKLAKGSEE